MADVSKRLAKGTQSSSTPTNIYTVPTGKRTFVKALTLCNIAPIDNNLTLTFGGTFVICMHKIKSYDTITIPFMDQILEPGESINISVSDTTGAGVSFYISGREVDV